MRFRRALTLAALFLMGCGGSVSNSQPQPDAGGTDAADVPDRAGGDARIPVDAGCLVGAGDFLTLCDGTFNALTLLPVDGTGFVQIPAPPSELEAGVMTRFVAFVEDKPSVCTTGALRQGGVLFNLDLLSGDSQLGAGTFTVQLNSVPGNVDVSMTKLDTACDGNSVVYTASSGSVVLTSVDATSVSGTFNVVMQPGATTLEGAFRVPLCGQFPVGTCSP